MKRAMKTFLRSIAALLLCAAFLLTCLPANTAFTETDLEEVQAATAKPLSLSVAKKMAVAYDEKLEALDLSIDAKKVAIQSAIRSLKEKKRSMSTFRWSPLLSFKFPTKPKEDEDVDFNFKPTKMNYELRILYHKVDDQKVAVYEKVSNCYTDIVTNQELLELYNERIKNNTDVVGKLEKKVRLGVAKQADLDKAQSNLDKLKKQATSTESKIIKSKKKLGSYMGIEITDEYSFQDPFVTMNVNRDILDSLKNYTINHDESVYEASNANEVQQISLRVNYSLMTSHYRKFIGALSGYIQQAMDGQRINKRAFKKAYDKFLKDIDKKWQGKKRILFIKIPREWFKGEIDGIRYVENEPYTLYNNALDYVTTQKELANTISDVESMVEDTYDNYIEYRTAYLEARENRQKLAEKLVKDEVLCLLGQMEQTEYDGEVSEYESAQDALNNALSTYTEALYSFERLTCGGLTQYFEGGSVDPGDAAKAAAQGLTPVYAAGATYSIKYLVDDEAFILYVDIPKDYEVKATHFALICDRVMIGGKTPVDQGLKHLTLAKNDIDQCLVRLYNGDTVVGDCEIDPSVSAGVLNLTTGFEEDAKEYVTIGKYETEDLMSVGMTRITPKPDDTQELYYYNVLTADNKKYLYSDELIEVTTPFDYVAVSDQDMANLLIRFYSAEKEPVYDAILSTSKQEMMVEKPYYDLWNGALAQKQKEEEEAMSAAEKAEKEAAQQEAAKTAKDTAKEDDTTRLLLMAQQMKKMLDSNKDKLMQSILDEGFKSNPNTKKYLEFYTKSRTDRLAGIAEYWIIFRTLWFRGQSREGMMDLHYQIGPMEWLAKQFFYTVQKNSWNYGNESGISHWGIDGIRGQWYATVYVLYDNSSGVKNVLKEAYMEKNKDEAEVALTSAFSAYIKSHPNVVSLSAQAINEIAKEATKELSAQEYLDTAVEEKIYEYYWSVLQKRSADEATQRYGPLYYNGYNRITCQYIDSSFEPSWLVEKKFLKPNYTGGWGNRMQ